MYKTVNIVSYMPGQGGNLLRFLLSLHPRTFPILPTDYKGNDPRVKIYSFKNMLWKYTSWNNFHEQFFSSTMFDITDFVNSTEYDTYTVSLHPGQDSFFIYVDDFFVINKENLEKVDKINFLQIKLSDELEYLIEDFKIENSGQMHMSPLGPRFLSVWMPLKGSVKYNALKADELAYTEKYHPYIINLDNFFYGEESFVEEYIKLSEFVNLPLCTEEAIELYQGWRSARKLYKHKLVKP